MAAEAAEVVEVVAEVIRRQRLGVQRHRLLGLDLREVVWGVVSVVGVRVVPAGVDRVYLEEWGAV